MVHTYRFPSRSSSRIYEVRDDDSGALSCTCPGWVYKRNNRPRGCRHVTEVQINPPAPSVESLPDHVQDLTQPASLSELDIGLPLDLEAGLKLYTIGYGGRGFNEFVAMLKSS